MTSSESCASDLIIGRGLVGYSNLAPGLVLSSGSVVGFPGVVQFENSSGSTNAAFCHICRAWPI